MLRILSALARAPRSDSCCISPQSRQFRNCAVAADTSQMAFDGASATRDGAAQAVLACASSPSGCIMSPGLTHGHPSLPAPIQGRRTSERSHAAPYLRPSISVRHRPSDDRHLPVNSGAVRPAVQQSTGSRATHYHTNTGKSMEAMNFFNGLPVRHEQLWQDNGNEVDAELPHSASFSPLSAPNFFGALNGYNTDEEEDLRHLSSGYHSSDEYSVDSSDDDAHQQTHFMPRGMEDVPPPPSWKQDSDAAFTPQQPRGTETTPDPLNSIIQQAGPQMVPPHHTLARPQPRSSHGDAEQAMSPEYAPDDDDESFSAPWRSPVAAGTAAPPAVDPRQAMRDTMRQRAAHAAADALEDVDLEGQVLPEHHVERRAQRRTRLPTTPAQLPLPHAHTQHARSVAASVLAQSAAAAGDEVSGADLEDLVALVSPLSGLTEGAGAQRHPYAAVHPVCEHQTWNLFTSAAAGLLSVPDLRGVVGSMRSALGLPSTGAATAGAATAAGAAAAEKPQLTAFQASWQDAVAVAQMQYVAEALRRTGRVPLTRPHDSAHARAAVSAHHDIAVTDHVLQRYAESRCWGEVERCADAIVAEAVAAEAAAAGAAGVAEAAAESAPAEDRGESAESPRHVARVQGPGVYGGVGVPLGGGIPAFAVVADAAASGRAQGPPGGGAVLVEAAARPAEGGGVAQGGGRGPARRRAAPRARCSAADAAAGPPKRLGALRGKTMGRSPRPLRPGAAGLHTSPVATPAPASLPTPGPAHGNTCGVIEVGGESLELVSGVVGESVLCESWTAHSDGAQHSALSVGEPFAVDDVAGREDRKAYA